MYHTETIEIHGNIFVLHPLKAMWHHATATVICSDIHIGKAEHFRKNGIAVHKMTNATNAWNLSHLFQDFPVKCLLVVGDIMHSDLNTEWDEFLDFLDSFRDLRRILVRGNHDRYPDKFYIDSGFEVVEDFEIDGVLFTHEPAEVPEGKYAISGHIHPAVRLIGKGRQSVRVPCFHFGKQQGLLPAFGAFTGTYTVQPEPEDRVFAITSKSVVRLGEVQ